jgi:hypothetical protein
MGMRGSRDEQIREADAGFTFLADYGRNDDTVAATCTAVEGDRLHQRFDLLQPRLALSSFERRIGQERAGCQLGGGDG